MNVYLVIGFGGAHFFSSSIESSMSLLSRLIAENDASCGSSVTIVNLRPGLFLMFDMFDLSELFDALLISSLGADALRSSDLWMIGVGTTPALLDELLQSWYNLR